MKLTKVQQKAYNSLNYEWQSARQLGECLDVLNKLCKFKLAEHRIFGGFNPRNYNEYRKLNYRYLVG